MQASPSQFEAIGSRIGLEVAEESAAKLYLTWRGARFPAFLSLGIALVLLFISVPILEALRQRGFHGPAASLWYFPIMNAVLLGIAAFLLSLRRTVLLNDAERRLVVSKRHLFRRFTLSVSYGEIAALKLGVDDVYSGFALAGSSAAQTYPVPALRVWLKNGESILLDRGRKKSLQAVAERISRRLGRPLETDES